MSIFNRTSQKGFTIVELLIVIVVIAILASITVVAYSGISQRARNVARVNAVKQMQNSVQIAIAAQSASAIRSTLNFSDNWYRACLGTGYADINSNGVGDCAYYGASPYVSESAAFKTAMLSYASVPAMNGYPKTTSNDGDVVAGPYLGSAWVDSTDMLVIEYSLEGEGKDCVLRPLVYNKSAPTLTPTATPTYTESGEGVTECIVVVANPV